MEEGGILIVVAAVVIRDGRLLLTRRGEGSHLAGFWELPGGKVEPGEDPVSALRRELKEELGIGSEIGAPFAFNYHDYGTRRVLLLTYEARLSGDPGTPGCAELGWFARDEIAALRTPPADVPIFERLNPLLSPSGS